MTVTGSSAGEVYYDPYDVDIDAGVQAVWKRLRDEAPLYWNERYGFYALSRYDDVLQAVLDTDTFRSSHATVVELISDAPLPPPRMMIWMDPPEHSWHRKLVSRAFTVKAVAGLEQRVTELCTSLLDGLAGRDEFDFVDDYAAIIPPTMILALLGFPEEMVDEWRHGIDEAFAIDGDEGMTAPGSVDLAGRVLFDALPGTIADRRAEPRDDLLSVLVHTELEEGDQRRPLTDDEVIGFIRLLAVAGTETVARHLGWSAVLLDRHPDQRALLADDLSLVPDAVEEILRYEAPSPVNARWVSRDVELHGRTVPAGSKLVLLNGAANRDERHFPDPDRFDVRRRIDRHLTFGYGAHFCIGAALARLEGQVALREMLRRHPAWEVDHDRAEMVHTSTVRGYAKVPVRV